MKERPILFGVDEGQVAFLNPLLRLPAGRRSSAVAAHARTSRTHFRAKVVREHNRATAADGR